MPINGPDSNQPHGINVLALMKGEERFVFLYDDESVDQTLVTLGKYAADPELNFSWYDAAVLSQRIRQIQNEAAATQTEVRDILSHRPRFDS